MKTPEQVVGQVWRKLKSEYKLAFFATVLLGLLVHMPAMMGDYPNHDGLDSLYFDQNMITSGRFFLTVACGVSSYFTIPWVIGLLGLVYLGITAGLMTYLFDLRKKWVIVAMSGLLVAFPAMASTFAYVFTLDGYMMGLMLAVLAVSLTKRFRLGFLPGALCLACSLGTYQAYLPIAILLCLYLAAKEISLEKAVKEKLTKIGSYAAMGALGMVLYFVLLQVLLFLQGKELGNYQGISNIQNTTGIGGSLLNVYSDFFRFSVWGKVLFADGITAVCILLLGVLFVCSIVLLAKKKGWFQSPVFYGVAALLVLLIPVAMNYILIVSPQINYHAIMRYHWVMFPIISLVLVEKATDAMDKSQIMEWVCLAAGLVLFVSYVMTDNIAYSNLQKKYEKTYAYCVRLLDRIEQTPGYYQGIPIAMIGVVGEDEFPATDLTRAVTDGLVGTGGDWLLYTGENYKAFIRNYLGATLNILDPGCMETIYYSKEYQKEMDSFPGPNATRVVDGILYVHTENIDRTLSFED